LKVLFISRVASGAVGALERFTPLLFQMSSRTSSKGGQVGIFNRLFGAKKSKESTGRKPWELLSEDEQNKFFAFWRQCYDADKADRLQEFINQHISEFTSDRLEFLDWLIAQQTEKPPTDEKARTLFLEKFPPLRRKVDMLLRDSIGGDSHKFVMQAMSRRPTREEMKEFLLSNYTKYGNRFLDQTQEYIETVAERIGYQIDTPSDAAKVSDTIGNLGFLLDEIKNFANTHTANK